MTDIERRDSESRVAYDMMRHIAGYETQNNDSRRSNREYWLDLYSECLHAASGGRSGQPGSND